jgi:hypothetical protein
MILHFDDTLKFSWDRKMHQHRQVSIIEETIALGKLVNTFEHMVASMEVLEPFEQEVVANTSFLLTCHPRGLDWALVQDFCLKRALHLNS